MFLNSLSAFDLWNCVMDSDQSLLCIASFWLKKSCFEFYCIDINQFCLHSLGGLFIDLAKTNCCEEEKSWLDFGDLKIILMVTPAH